MRHKLYWLAVFLTGIGVFFGVKMFWLTNARAAGRVSFTVEYQRLSKNKQGIQTLQSRHLYAVRGDGSIAQRDVIVRANQPTTVTATVVLPTIGKSYVVSHSLQRISTRTITEGQRARFQRFESQGGTNDPLCGSTQGHTILPLKFVGQDNLLGFQVARYEGQFSEQRVTSYFAQQLNCFEVKSLTEWLDQQRS